MAANQTKKKASKRTTARKTASSGRRSGTGSKKKASSRSASAQKSAKTRKATRGGASTRKKASTSKTGARTSRAGSSRSSAKTATRKQSSRSQTRRSGKSTRASGKTSSQRNLKAGQNEFRFQSGAQEGMNDRENVTPQSLQSEEIETGEAGPTNDREFTRGRSRRGKRGIERQATGRLRRNYDETSVPENAEDIETRTLTPRSGQGRTEEDSQRLGEVEKPV